DMNYFLGIRPTDNVLVADFEDTATSGNHPIAGTTAIPADGAWRHAAATYDGTTWRLYLNGALEAQLVVGSFTPQSAGTQHGALGTASHGAASVNPNNTISYLPVTGYNGSDSFSYTISDGQGATATGTVNVTITSVNVAPVAVADSYNTNKNVALIVPADGVLGN